MHSWLAIGLIMLTLGGLMLALRMYQRRRSPHPEMVRKLLHMSMGLMTLSFPWLFDSAVPVIILAGLAVVWLVLLRFHKWLRQELGTVLGGVERRSLGEIYFPVSVALVFVLAQGEPLLFGIPVLILTLADAIAAMIGVRYGQVRYTTTEGFKSAEGSLAFFMATFFSVHIPLLLLSPTGRAETLLIAVILGLLVMLLEAIAWRGLDNLFIPVGGFVLLRSHLTMSVSELLVRLALTVVLVVFVLSWRKRTTLNDSALLGAAFVGYLSWTLGGWRWLLPPLILLLIYPRFVSWVDQQKTPLTVQEQQIMLWLPHNPDSRPRQWERIHTIHAVLSVCAAGLFWLVLFVTFDRPVLLLPYTFAFAANLAIIGVAGLSPLHYWHRSRWLKLVLFVLLSWLLMVLPLLGDLSRLTIDAALIGLISTGLSAIAYYVSQPYLRRFSTDAIAWWCRAIITTLASSLVLLPLRHFL